VIRAELLLLFIRVDSQAARGVDCGDTVDSTYDDSESTETDDGEYDDEGPTGGVGRVPDDGARSVSHGRKKQKPIPPDRSLFLFTSTNR